MGRFWFMVYNLLVPILFFGFWLSSFFDRKTRQSFSGRAGQADKLKQYLNSVPPGFTRIWVHCVSVGEWLQALPIIQVLKESNPNLIVVVSFFSSSGYNYLKSKSPIDFKFYLPFDFYRSARSTFTILKPDLWIVSKFDVWPNHMHWAGKLGVPTVLIAATLSADTGRLKEPVATLNRYVYRNFSWLFPISNLDRDRLLKLFPHPARMVVAGDTRFDSVFQKWELVQASGTRPVFEPVPEVILLAGSIWPTDEQHLLPALKSLLLKHQNLSAVLVPHELHENQFKTIEGFFGDSFATERYSVFEARGHTKARIAIVDTVGKLAGLYLNCDLAYVGGSFGVGVHNVMEPAVFGKPVLFGPKHVNSFEALELKRLGGGFEVNDRSEIERQLDILISNTELRTSTGETAKGLVMNNLGATGKILEKLKQEYDFIS